VAATEAATEAVEAAARTARTARAARAAKAAKAGRRRVAGRRKNQPNKQEDALKMLTNWYPDQVRSISVVINSDYVRNSKNH